MVSAGVDIGSRSIELVLLQDGEVVSARRADTTFDPLGQCGLLTEGQTWDRLAVTGYGRKLYAKENGDRTVTEIQAYALGAHHLFPGCRTILDIGGQDTKAISLDASGRMVKFEMNDRCAAGTGKFLEFMAGGMSLDMGGFGPFALRGRPGIAISSMCTVFAETEATSLMARGQRAEDIALALHQSVVKRSMAMLRRVGLVFPVVFAGGVARNPAMAWLLSEAMGGELLIPEQPEMVGALGAALFAAGQ